MKSRIDGVQRQKHHLYAGLTILPKEEFYAWANGNADFHRLFKDYVDSGFQRKMAPSADRLDSKIGYEIGNMEFVTMSENSRRGTCSRFANREAIFEPMPL